MSSSANDDVDLRSDSGSHSWTSAFGEGRRRWPRASWITGGGEETEQTSEADQGQQQMQEDSSDDDMTTVHASPSLDGAPSKDELALIQEAIATCYREVWREFYEWEPYDSLQTLRSLSAVTGLSAPSRNLEDGDWTLFTGQNVFGTEDDMDGHPFEAPGDDELFEVYEWDADGTLCESTMAPAVILSSSSSVTAHPRYEACTPTYACIDPEVSSSQPECRFIKYAGQPRFDESGYLRKFHSISWQQPCRDPDRKSTKTECISYEIPPYWRSYRPRRRLHHHTAINSLGI